MTEMLDEEFNDIEQFVKLSRKELMSIRDTGVGGVKRLSTLLTSR